MNDPRWIGGADRARDGRGGPGRGETTDRGPLAGRGDMALYVISVAAELAGVHPQTLRIYERKGLLDPARTEGGNRRYSDNDIARLRRIQELTNAGLNLEGVRWVMALEEENDRLRQALAQARLDAQAAVEATHKRYRRELVPLSQLPAPFGRR